MARAERSSDQRLVELTVLVSPAELSALSNVAVVVTSAVDVGVINAADNGFRRVREAAAKHPKLPARVKDQPR